MLVSMCLPQPPTNRVVVLDVVDELRAVSNFAMTTMTEDVPIPETDLTSIA